MNKETHKMTTHQFRRRQSKTSSLFGCQTVPTWNNVMYDQCQNNQML